MADAKRTVELVFQGVDKTGAATQAALNNTNKFAGNIQSATQPIANFTESALKLEATLLASGAVATAFAVKIAGDFDGAFREIATLIDQPIESLGAFKQAILDYAQTSTQPLDQVTQAIYSAISAGVDFGDSIAAVSQAEQLAVAGKADLNNSLVVLISSLNAYGLGIDSAQRFSDALFTTVKQGQTTLPELSANLAQVTGTAATLEVPFETLLAAIATLTKTGTPTAQAVTQISAVLAGLLKPSDGAAKTAAALGIEFSAQAVKAKGLETVLSEVAAATGGNEEVMAKLFPRVEALRAVFPLTGKAAGEFADILGAMEDKSGAAGEAFDKMAAAFQNSSQQVKNSLEVLFVKLGDPLLDEFGGVAEALTAIFAAIGESADAGAIQEVVEFIESQMAGLQETLEQVAANLPEALNQADLSGFQNGVIAVSDALGVLFNEIDITSTEGLAAAITAVGSAFEGLSRFSAGVIESFKPLFDEIVNVAKGITDLDAGTFQVIGNIAGFTTQANALAGALIAVIPAVQGLLAVIGISQSAGLIGSMFSAAGALSGSSGLVALLGKGGLVGAAGAAGVALGTLLNKGTEFATGSSISTWVLDGLEALGFLPSYSDEATAALNTLPEPIYNTARAAEESEQRILAYAQAMRSLSDSSEEGSDGLFKFAEGQELTGRVVENLAPIYDIATGKVIGYGEGLRDVARSSGEFDESGSKASDTLSRVSDESTKAADATKKLGDEAKRTQEVLEAMINASAAVAVAQIEADAEKMVAAFESVNTTIESTGDQLTELFGLLGDENISKFDKLGIKDQIEKENERREEALEQQSRLTDAQIRALNAQADALTNGSPLVTINADGLKPHLQAILFELLEEIQIQTNRQGLALLLGTP